MAPGSAKMSAKIETTPVIGLCHSGWRLERHCRPLIRLSAFRKRQRDQHAAANKPVPHQAPTCARPQRGPLRSRSPASRGGTQAERKNYAELVTIVQMTAGRLTAGCRAVNTSKRNPGAPESWRPGILEA